MAKNGFLIVLSRQILSRFRLPGFSVLLTCSFLTESLVKTKRFYGDSKTLKFFKKKVLVTVFSIKQDSRFLQNCTLENSVLVAW